MGTRHSISSRTRSLALTLMAGALALLTACSPGGGSGSASGGTSGGTSSSAGAVATSTSGPAATATPAPAPQHVFAWFQYDASLAPQIWASVNGASPHQITHVGPPPTDGCDDRVAWSPPVFSPNLQHIAASLGSYNCGDGYLMGPVAVVDASTGAIAQVPGNHQIRLTERDAGWINSNTIWFITTSGSLYTYSLGASSVTQLPGVSNASEGALRGTTLFWQSTTFGTTTFSYSLHRYDMSTHGALAGAISQGSVGSCACSPGDYSTPGWDASPDGSHIVYQVVSPSGSSSGGITSSHVYYANADGSGASQIAHAMVTNALFKAQISPNGQWVAFAGALPSPATLTASVSSPGGVGDSTFRGYSPDTYNYPVWKWDSTQFWAASIAAGDAAPGTSHGSLYRFTRGGGSAVGVAGGYNPWYTIA